MSLPTRVVHGYVDPIESAQREFNGVLGRLFGAQGDGGGRLAPFGVDVREDADHFYVDAELPGFRKDDIDITLENSTLTISAERNAQKEENGKKGDWLLRERRYNRFLRSFTLPPTVDEKTVDAKLNDGILSVTLNKREETKPRKISVS
ncbi:MAG TPA: Hsp20/alpha crystallin family protein [Chthoniobacterales bacterium]|nr:Hsp20/alpha crystallin family protein [Chthoniobacterales bacterium]